MQHRFHNLDAMRGICAVLVALFHTGWVSHARQLPIVANGWLFVDYFFILSGFVISYKYMGRTATAWDLRDFLVRRLFRLFPVHLVALVLFVGLLLLGDRLRGTSVLSDMLAHQSRDIIAATFLMHGLGVSQPTMNAPSWSISAELWTYVVFALTGLFFLRRQAWAMIVMGVAAGLALLLFNAPKGLFTAFEYGFPRCLAGFAIGVSICAFLPHSRWATLPSCYAYAGYAALGALTMVVLSVSMQDSMTNIAALPLFAGIVAIGVMDRNSKVKTVMESRPLVRLGELSYSTYMLHAVVLAIVSAGVTRFSPDLKLFGAEPTGHETMIWRGDLVNFVYVFLILAVADVTHRFVEVPWRDYGKQLVLNKTLRWRTPSPVRGRIAAAVDRGGADCRNGGRAKFAAVFRSTRPAFLEQISTPPVKLSITHNLTPNDSA
jgi:peptidoglycan/LPS O-acetylase OafA/YrhL